MHVLDVWGVGKGRGRGGKGWDGKDEYVEVRERGREGDTHGMR